MSDDGSGDPASSPITSLKVIFPQNKNCHHVFISLVALQIIQTYYYIVFLSLSKGVSLLSNLQVQSYFDLDYFKPAIEYCALSVPNHRHTLLSIRAHWKGMIVSPSFKSLIFVCWCLFFLLSNPCL